MTSGVFASVLISSITIDRAKRQRRTLDGIPELAKSIATTGLINPPVVSKNGDLVAGERRLEACRSLGWTSIPVQWAEDLSEPELHLIELEENTRRMDLPWQDQCRAVQEYHRLRKAEPNWNQNRTAEALNLSPQSISHFLSVAEQMENGNARIINAPKFLTAQHMVSREADRKRTSIISKIEGKQDDVPIACADFLDWSESYTGEPFNFLHCDFPYGIGANNIDQGVSVQEHGSYSDKFSDYESLLSILYSHQNKLVAESAHIMFWFSMDYYEWTRNELERMGWTINPFPLIWHKSDNTGLLPDPARGPRRIYETCFFGSRGDRKIVRPVSNLFSAPVVKEHHMSEKNLSMLTYLMGMFVDEYTSILDPTCGSGNACIAAKKNGASRILGLERDSTFAERAQAIYRSAILGDGESNG